MFEKHKAKKAEEACQTALSNWQAERDGCAELAQNFKGTGSDGQLMLQPGEAIFYKVTGAALIEDRSGAPQVTSRSCSGVGASRPQPERHVSRLHRPLNGSDELRADRLQLDVVPNPVGKGGHCGLSVISGPIETVVHQPLDPPAQGVEQGDSDQGGCRDSER